MDKTKTIAARSKVLNEQVPIKKIIARIKIEATVIDQSFILITANFPL